MKEFIQLMVAGAVTGAIYSLIAAGLTVSYTATGIFNLAYGAIAFDAAYLYYQLNSGLGWPSFIAFLFVILLFCPLLGLLLNVAVFRPLAKATDAAKIMATVGLLVALPAIPQYIVEGGRSTFDWGIPDLKNPPVTTPPGIYRTPPSVSRLWFDVNLTSNQITILVVAIIVAISLWVVLRKTRLGLQMRAVVDKPELANLRGVDDGRTSAVAWIIGTVLAGLAGVVGAPVLNSLEINQFNIAMFIAIAAVVLGRMKSVPLAFAGGMFLGVAQNVVARYFPKSVTSTIPGFKNSVPFVILLLGLLLLAREKNRRSGSVVSQPPPATYTDDLPKWRVQLPWAIAVALFIVWGLFVVDDVWLGLFANGLALAVVLMSFVIVTGQGGMVSLAQAAFVTAAAFMAGRFMVEHNWPLPLALAVGVFVSMVLGIIVSLPALRLGGLPLALATLALGFLGDEVLFKWNWLRRSQGGWDYRAKSRDVFGLNLRNDKTMFIVLIIVLALLTLLVFNLAKSASGRAITAVRNSEPAASSSGLSIPRTKLSMFALSSAVAGLGGVLLATRNGAIADGTFPTQLGLAWLASAVLFGIRKPQGAIIAGIVTAASNQIFTRGFHFFFLPSFLHWDGLGSSTATHISSVMFGIGAIQLAREPDGILAITAAQNRAKRDKRRAKRGESVAAAGAGEATIDVRAQPAVSAVPSSGELAFVARDVRSGYGLVEVLHGISLGLPKGHITAVLGPNGAGKSTMCQTFAGLVRSTAGTISLHGSDVTALAAHARAKRGVVLAPEARGIFPGLTVKENLSLWLPSSSDIEQAYERFPILGERRNLPAGNLSGGEQQMLTLTPLLVRPPDVLIADEPSLGLAPLIVEQIMQIFVELRDRGCALLLVEEKARDVLQIADSVAFLSLGEITWYGAQADVDADRLAAAYLGDVSS